ncbi:leucyl aminopeptidase [Mycoplasma sp. T363T]|uniref:leucyl aminopeptidase n=1 Tax=Mycoplasma bradburyae TaxID=2963128 RepID=UPI0020CB7F52|nr:leucyl aminopeptidase [Mycoplasma bradburyae]MDC4163421.1 leucyl aminopeptidase [Mycoplasma bradburyae]UTS71181.1 leucyl aminopeptidase [Mycoplasma bradburyae]
MSTKTKKTEASSKKLLIVQAKVNNKLKDYSFKTEDGIVLFEFMSHYDGVKLYKKLVEMFCAQKDKVEVDVDSFLSLVEKDIGIDSETVALSLACAIEYASVIPFTRKTKPDTKPSFVIKVTKDYKPIYDAAKNIAQAMTLSRRLQDTPSDVLYPESFVEIFKEEFKDLKNIKISVYNREQVKKMGLNLLYGVNKGSDRECRFLVVEYLNNKASKEVFAYVGKGITYDSGGMNLKTGPHMRHMKYDMSGAAIVMSTVLALAKNKIKTNVIALAPLTENLIGPKAQRPDDIVVAYNKKTVEIDNTDAEGRLVLADAISYAALDLKATRIFDVATLTGLMSYILGKTYTGIFSTSDKYWEEFKKNAEDAGEPVWRLPMHKDYLETLKTPLADIANSTNSPHAGSSRAAMFLNEFAEGVDLIHCDIAGTGSDQAGLGLSPMLRALYQQAKNQK